MVDSTKTALHKRVNRYAKVSGAFAKVGVQIAGRKLRGSRPEDSGEIAKTLRGILGGLKGPLMKVAQILSAIPDAVPPEFAAEFAQLQADAPPMGRALIERRMRTELGVKWRDKFSDFDMNAAASASLGQVHRASALDGTLLACKLQYPDMASVVDADLQQLKIAMKIFETFDGGAISLAGAWTEICERLHEELDYNLEAKHILLYRGMLDAVENVHVPRVYNELSTSRLLSMQWCEGKRFKDASGTYSQALRNKIALNMFNAWYIPFYRYGVIHGDPHPGNYTIRPDGSINLLDFGCIRVFPARLVNGVIMLWQALLANDDELAVAAYESWGFKSITKELLDTLNIWARFVYAPMLEDRVRGLDETNNGKHGRWTAGIVHEQLKKIGGVVVPREFVFIDRATIGLGGVFLQLGAQLNWYRIFCELTHNVEESDIAKRQKNILQSVGLYTTSI